MPAPPKKGETQNSFISRCISYMIENENKTQSQAAGFCYGMWRSGKKKSKLAARIKYKRTTKK
uniref:Uncharacterized protein n=1 Tax=viral metagenome TaxID=1070528 RepID=A0A6M3J4I6_9ZZZZ